jgi:plastocyanin
MRPVIVRVPPVAPNLASFVATPAVTQIGVPTNVTWTWTYTAPPVPAPTCSISPTVGAVTNGQITSLTQNFGQTYTLQCVNTAGTRTRTVFVNAATAPVIAAFTATPSTVTIDTPTSITFAWSFSNTPSPTATCSIDQGIGPITSGSARTLTLAATTIYTLTCTNTGGSAMQPVTITAQ